MYFVITSVIFFFFGNLRGMQFFNILKLDGEGLGFSRSLEPRRLLFSVQRTTATLVGNKLAYDGTYNTDEEQHCIYIISLSSYNASWHGGSTCWRTSLPVVPF